MGAVSRGLLDTSVLIARYDDAESALLLPQEVSISVATLAELHFGVLVAKDEITRRQRLLRLGSIESAFQPIPIDTPVARAFAAIAHAVKISGRQPGHGSWISGLRRLRWYIDSPSTPEIPRTSQVLRSLSKSRSVEGSPEQNSTLAFSEVRRK